MCMGMKYARLSGGRTQEVVVLVSKLINQAAVGKPVTIIQDIFCLLKNHEPYVLWRLDF